MFSSSEEWKVAGFRDADAEPGKTATHPAFFASSSGGNFSNPTSISSGVKFSNSKAQAAVISQTQPISQAASSSSGGKFSNPKAQEAVIS